MAAKKPTTIKKQLRENMKDSSMRKVRVLGGTAQAGLPKTTKDMQKYSSMAKSTTSKKVTLSGSAKPKPTVKPKAPVKKVNPEKLLQQYLNQGMNLDKARKKVSDQTGVWPN